MSEEQHEGFSCGKAVVVPLRGEIDLATADHMLRSLLRAAATPSCTCVVADLSRVEFFDASGARAVMGAYRQLTRDGQHLVLAEPSGVAQRVIAALGLDRYVDVYPLVASAIPQPRVPH